MCRSGLRVLASKASAYLVLLLLGPLGKAGDALVWSKVRAGLGGRVKVLVSGGSKLPNYLDDFYEMVGCVPAPCAFVACV